MLLGGCVNPANPEDETYGTTTYCGPGLPPGIPGIPGMLPAGSGTKTKKIMYDLADNDDFDREEIATYEEVARLFPRPGIFRPVVLIGAPGVGRNELKRRLMATEPDRYKTTIPRKLLNLIRYTEKPICLKR